MRRFRRRSEQDLEEEIRSHLGHEADRLVAEGLPREEAELAARRRFGSVNAVREEFRATQPAPLWENLWKDLTLALRSIRREPWFAASAVATLALGIGLNTAIFTVLYGFTMRPLPLPAAEQLVTVHQLFADMPVGSGLGDATIGGIGGRPRYIHGSTDMVSYPEYRAYRDGTTALSGLAAFASIGLTLEGETPAPAAGLLVSCGYFRVVGVGMEAGRGFVEDECARGGGAPVVVLSHGLWQRRFGGDPSIVGRSITLNRTVFTVIGVAARGFGGTQLHAPDVYLPVTMQPVLGSDRLANEDLSWLNLVGRLRVGATVERAERELTATGLRRDAAYQGRGTRVLVHRAALMSGPVGREHGLVGGLVAMAVAVLIVLIACLNLMNLLLSRAPARQRSVRIRLSLGASRRRIVTQLLVESGVLAALGGATGLLLAYWAPPLLLAAWDAGATQLLLTPDLRVFAYATLVSLCAALLFGLAPALETTRVDLATALRGDGAAGGAGRSPRAARLRHAVVGAQVGGSLLLLVVAALFIRGVRQARATDPGYHVQDVLGFRPNLEQQGYDAARAAAYYRELRARAAALPGVASASLASWLPLGPRGTGRFARDGAEEDGLVDYTTVSGGYFETLGIAIARGRAFAEDEPFAADARPAVIGQAMARRYWPSSDPLGQGFSIAGTQRYVVVGIARDTRHFSIQPSAEPLFYRAARLDPLPPAPGDTAVARPPGLTLVVRTTGGESTTSALLRAARGIDPDVLITVESLAERFDAELRPARLTALFAGLLGLLATALAMVGVYGAIAYAVTQRRHEIGVRFALGAARRDIIRLILRQGAAPLLAGIVTGMLLAAGVARVVRSQIFGISALDPVAFLGVTMALVGVALLAMVQPARRAAGIDPASTLRAD